MKGYSKTLLSTCLGAAALLLAGASAAQATVRYDFSELGAFFGDANFSYTAPGFINTYQTVTPQTCSIPSGDNQCDTIRFEPGPNSFGGTDSYLGFNFNHNDGNPGGTGFFFFDPTAFSKYGVYTTDGYPAGTPGYGNAGSAILRVSAAPEPSTWALMIVGVGGAGFALRRARRRQTDGLASAVAA